ncbi:MAG TPA: hypothetical protein PKJ08_13400, partial [Candidatus Cloacimonadota bacterium]|nr:hypothetical protein [Candidatus Cloacimonadota bacterium]
MAEYQIQDKVLLIEGQLNKVSVAKLYSQILKDKHFKEIDYISLKKLEEIDSAGVAMLDELILKLPHPVPVRDMSEIVKDTISVFESRSLPENPKPKKAGIF